MAQAQVAGKGKPAAADKYAKTRVTTPEFRVSFAHVFKPSAYEGQEPKYSVVMLFPKSTDIKALKIAAAEAVKAKYGEDKTKWPKNLKLPFRDGDVPTGDREEPLDGYAGHYFVNATSKERPDLVDGKLSPIAETDGTFYSGCYAHATINAYCYDVSGNKGVAFGLNNIQKLRDGKSFAGKKAAVDDFDAVEDVDGVDVDADAPAEDDPFS
jgi:hypothetical protein